MRDHKAGNVSHFGFVLFRLFLFFLRLKWLSHGFFSIWQLLRFCGSLTSWKEPWSDSKSHSSVRSKLSPFPLFTGRQRAAKSSSTVWKNDVQTEIFNWQVDNQWSISGLFPTDSRFSMKVSLENEYKMTMTLTIRNLSAEFFGGYRCIVRNSLGETDGMIRLYGEWERELEKGRFSSAALFVGSRTAE